MKLLASEAWGISPSFRTAARAAVLPTAGCRDPASTYKKGEYATRRVRSRWIALFLGGYHLADTRQAARIATATTVGRSPSCRLRSRRVVMAQTLPIGFP